MTGIEFSICTYNRSAYLKKCVDRLLSQLIPGRTLITIVDNNSIDDTREWVVDKMVHFPGLRYISEPKQGLSIARNTAWAESLFEWVFYLDDDCLPPENFVKTALQLVDQSFPYDAFGGPVVAVFNDERPDWLPVGFGSFSMPYHELHILTTGFLRGPCFMVKRNVLQKLGGFNTALGVKGNALRYGEEIEFQMRMREAGYRIGYTPALSIEHFIRTDKLDLHWVLRSEFSRRRDKVLFDPVSMPRATLHLCRTTLGRVLWTPIHFYQFLTSKSYSGKKALYDIFKPLAFSTGEWWGTLKRIAKR